MEWQLVVAADHPLARHRGELSEADLLSHTQLLPAPGESISSDMIEAMRLCPRHISCQRLFQLQELLMMGMGFAFLPRYVVGSLVESGTLVVLDYEGAVGGLNAWDNEVRWTRSGPAAKWLLDTLSE